MTTEVQKSNEVRPSNTEEMAKAILPFYVDGTKQGTYLSWLVSYFSVTESLQLTGVTMKTLTRWREDELFAQLEEKAKGELRRDLADNLMDIEWTRNMRLILAKDFEILLKATTEDPSKPKTLMTDFDRDYLKVIRKFYTPEQLARIRSMTGTSKDNGDEQFDYTKLIMEYTIREERIQRG